MAREVSSLEPNRSAMCRNSASTDAGLDTNPTRRPAKSAAGDEAVTTEVHLRTDCHGFDSGTTRAPVCAFHIFRASRRSVHFSVSAQRHPPLEENRDCFQQ